jgi:hypothetical protein
VEQILNIPSGVKVLTDLFSRGGSIHHLSEEMAIGLPRHLTSFTIHLRNQFQGSPFWIYLPRTLERLTLRSAIASKDEELEEEEIGSFRAKELPPFLRQLTLDMISVTPEFYGQLPKSLQIVDLKLVNLSFDAWTTIALEMPSLTNITISTQLPPSSSWKDIMRFLPRKLRCFIWRCLSMPPWKTDLENSDLKDLPRGLTYLALSSSPNVTSECLTGLPPHLRTLILERIPDWFGV